MSATTLALFAVAPPGLEELVAAEVAALGARPHTTPGGVSWRGPTEQLYQANLHLATATRVLVRMREFNALSFSELETHLQRVPWELFLRSATGVRLRVSSGRSRLYHEAAIAERLHRAIERRVGSTPIAAADAHDQQMFVLRLVRNRAVLSADSSGAPLHMRGYRQEIGRAPLRESIAAAMVRVCEVDERTVLIDPFCGSGTIPIEAALQARRIAPGIASADRQPRSYQFQRWPTHDPTLWQTLVARAQEQVKETGGPRIVGADRSARALQAARGNAGRAGVLDDIEFRHDPLPRLVSRSQQGCIVTNPPYGRRLGSPEELLDLYRSFGHVVRSRFQGWHVVLLSADERFERALALPLTPVLRTRSGGIPLKLLSGRLSARQPERHRQDRA